MVSQRSKANGPAPIRFCSASSVEPGASKLAHAKFSVFALASSLEVARQIGEAMQRAFNAESAVGADLWVSLVGRQGARVIS